MAGLIGSTMAQPQDDRVYAGGSPNFDGRTGGGISRVPEKVVSPTQGQIPVPNGGQVPGARPPARTPPTAGVAPSSGVPNFTLPPPVPSTAPTIRPAQAGTVQASTGQANVTQAGVTDATTGRANTGQATTREWTPTQRAVNADTETVQGQLRRALDAGGPLMERAVARSNDMMNARGLLSSSMASTAALDAMLGQALQIASPDAQTYGTAARDNWTAANQAGQFNAGEFNQTERFNVGEGNQTERLNTAEANQTSRLNATERNQTSRLNASEANQTSRFNTGEANQTARQNAAETNQTNRFNAGAQNEFLGREQQAGLERDRMREGATLDAARAEQNARIQADYARLSAQLDTASRERLMAIEQNYRTLTNSSGQAAQVVSQMQQDIGRILSDPNIAQENKQGLIDRIIQNTNSALRTIGVINGVDYGNLLNFGGGSSAPTPAPAPAGAPAPAPAPVNTGGAPGGGPGPNIGQPDGRPWWEQPGAGPTGGGN